MLEGEGFQSLGHICNCTLGALHGVSEKKHAQTQKGDFDQHLE